MNDKYFKVFFLFGFHPEGKDSIKLYAMFCDKHGDNYQNDSICFLPCVKDDRNVSFHTQQYVVRLMQSPLGIQLTPNHKYLRMYLASRGQVIPEIQIREFRYNETNFFFNVQFSQYPQMHITNVEQFSFFQEFASESNELSEFFTDSIALCPSLSNGETWIYLSILKEIVSLCKSNILLAKVIRVFNLKLITEAQESELTDYQKTIEDIQKEEVLNFIISFQESDLFSEKLLSNYQMLIVGFYLKLRMWKEFLNFIFRFNNQHVTAIVDELVKYEKFYFMGSDIIISLVSCPKMPVGFFENVIRMACDTKTKLKIIFTEYALIKKNSHYERLNFLRMLDSRDYEDNNILLILSTLEDRYLKVEDVNINLSQSMSMSQSLDYAIPNITVDDMVDINICAYLQNATKKCTKLHTMVEIRGFFHRNNTSDRITELNKTQSDILRKLNELINREINISDPMNLKCYFTTFHFIETNCVDLLKVILSDNQSGDSIALTSSSFNLSQIDEEFIMLFVSISFVSLFPASIFKKFIQQIAQKVKSEQDFRCFIRLFPVDEVMKYSDDIYSHFTHCLFAAFTRLIDSSEECVRENYFKVLDYFLAKEDYIMKEKYSGLITQIFQSWKLEKFIYIHIPIIEHIQSSSLLNVFFSFISDKLANISLPLATKAIDRFDKQIWTRKEESFLFYIVDNLRAFIIKEDDFFSKEDNERIRLLYDLISHGVLNIRPIQSTTYYTASLGLLNAIKILLIDQRATLHYYQRWEGFSPDEFNNRLVLLCFNSSDPQLPEFTMQMQSSLELSRRIMCSLDEVLRFCKNFCKDISEIQYEISRMEQLKEMISTNSLQNVYMFYTALPIIHNFSSCAKKFNDAYQSEIFHSLAKKQKIHYSLTSTLDPIEQNLISLEKAFQRFLQLKFLLDEECFFNASVKEIDELFSDIKHSNIPREINFLKTFLKIETYKYHTDYIEKTIQVLRSREVTSFRILNIEKICQFFHMRKLNQYDNKNSRDILQNIDANVSVKQYMENYNQIISKGFDFIENSEFCTLIELLLENKNLLEFLEDKKEDDIRGLIEFVDEIGDSFIKVESIKDLVKVLGFVIALRSENEELDELGFMNKSYALFMKNPKILAHAHNVIDKLNGIQQLYSKIVNREEFSKFKIKEMFKSSTFELLPSQMKDTSGYFITVNYGEKNTKCDFSEVIELRDRSLLLSKKKIVDKSKLIESQYFDAEEANFLQVCRDFSNIVNNIVHLLDDINDLYAKGDPGCFKMKILVNQQDVRVRMNDNDNETKLEDVLASIKNSIRMLNEELISTYEKCPVMRFFYGRQFKIMYDYLQGEGNASDSHRLIRYVTSTNQIPLKREHDMKVKCNDVIRDMFEQVNLYIEQCLLHSNVELENMLERNTIRYKDHKPGIYCYLVSEIFLELEIIHAYLTLTQNVPLLQTMLICNDTTSKEQIVAFIYRSLKFPGNVPFFILKADKIGLEKRQIIANLLKVLYTTNMKSTLVLTYFDRESDLIEHVLSIDNCKNLSLRPFDIKSLPSIAEWITKCISNVYIVSSDASGVGKSTFIQQKAYDTTRNYIYFPLGGDVTTENILSRLCNLTFPVGDKISLLHVDLSECADSSLMRDFLFTFLIAGGASANDEIFILEDNVEIAVELPCEFVDFRKQYQILNVFPNIFLEKANPPRMRIAKDDLLKSNIQIVCNYIYYLEKNQIKDHNVYIGCNCGNQTHQDICPKRASVPLIQIPDEKCEEYIKRYMKSRYSLTYYQINSFINVLAEQLKKLSSNIYFNVPYLQSVSFFKKQDLLVCRPLMVNSLINLTKYFTTGAYTDLIAAQELAYRSYSLPVDSEAAFEKDNEKAIEFLGQKNIVTFDKIPYSLVFFNEDGQSLSIISRGGEHTTENRQLSKLWSSGGLGSQSLVDYSSLNHEQFIEEIEKVLNKKVDKSQLEEYVFTRDNYIKIILILLRTRAKIPVIMMGETGCGKTSLIRILSKLKGNLMLVLSIHAGITDEDIIKFMDLTVIPLAEVEEVVWVFFDEINTCHSMGMISEIMCKNSMQGKILPNNIAFAAACNPYRKITNYKLFDTGLVNKKEHYVRKLVYSVNPLPHSLLNFVFDFGSLTAEDEARYIEAMLSKVIVDHKSRSLAVDAITTAQGYIKVLNDVSSVSLRDVRRFGIFYKWFIDSIKDRIAISISISHSHVYSYLSEQDISLYSIILGIFICYYIRIPSKEDRDGFKYNLVNAINSHNKNNLSTTDLDVIFTTEMKDIFLRIKRPKGIALNQALLENFFTLFVCVNNKIPVFLCGKPGCSKSLSVQLLYSAMRGPDSSDEYLKKLPRLFMNCYQGSMTSTSKGVLKIFEKARSMLKDNQDENIISMIFFDEMGLAEISKNNPLKVIHSQLEYDENQEKVAFVGISNWRLDASKMNRGIFLSRPDPDEKDLIETAQTIAQSYENEIIKIHENIFTVLAQTYFKYKNYLKDRMSSKEDFHGTRDFYHLIKYVARNMIKELDSGKPVDKYSLEYLANEALERNFGGLDESVDTIKNLFRSLTNLSESMNQYNVMKCIKDNLEDDQARYLILISKSSISPYLLDSFLIEKNIDYSVYIGSSFEDDINQEDYSYKILNKVQICMEQGKMLVLKNLEMIFPSLYDLFNQNFNEVGGKFYARIALGISNNPMAYVKKTFKCVILLDPQELWEQDPPFLNRFEKHIVSFENVLPEKYIKIFKEIKKIIKSMTVYPDHKIAINLQHHLMNCDDEEILGLIYQCYKNAISDPTKILYEIFLKIVPTFSQDLIAALGLSSFVNINEIYQIYKNTEHRNLERYLKSMNSIGHTRHLVYTFSSILDHIPFGTDIEAEKVEEKMISMFKTENELEVFLNEFYKNPSLNYLIMKFRPEDCVHMNLLKFLNDTLIRECGYPEKVIVFTVHLVKLIDGDNSEFSAITSNDLISNLSNYKQIFIDNLRSSCLLQITDVLNMTTENLFLEKRLFDIEDSFISGMFPSLMKIVYNFTNGGDEKEYRSTLIEKIRENRRIQETLIRIILKMLSTKENVITSLLTMKTFIKKDTDMLSTLQVYMKSIFEECMARVIVNLEKLDGIEFCMYKDDIMIDNTLLSLWEEMVSVVTFTEIKVNKNNLENEIHKVRGLHIPFFQNSLVAFLQKIKPITEAYISNEDKLRFSHYENQNEITQQLGQYHQEKSMLCESALWEFNNAKLFAKLKAEDRPGRAISSSLSLSCHQYILRDYIKYYTAVNGGKTVESEKLLQYIIDLKFNEREYYNPYEYLVNVMLWCDAYSSSIQVYLRDIDALENFHGNVTEKVKQLIESRGIVYPFTDPVRKYKKEINNIFFLITDAIVRICIPTTSLLKSTGATQFDLDRFYFYLNQIKSISQDAAILDARLYFFGKELPELETFLKFQNLIEQGQDPNLALEMISPLEDFQQRENKILRESYGHKQEEELISLLNEQFMFFKNSLTHSNKFSQFVADLFIGKYIKISHEQYRLKLMNLLIADNEYLPLSRRFLELPMSKHESLIPDFPGDDKDMSVAVDNFCSFANENDYYFDVLEKESKRSILDELLLYIFECKILQFFEVVNNNSNSNSNELIYGLAIKYLEKSINHLESNHLLEKRFEYVYPRLACLYSLAYVKIFSERYTRILYYKNAEYQFTEINKIISGNGDNPVRQMIKIYILKSIRRLMGSYEEFKGFLVRYFTYQLGWVKDFAFEETVPCNLDYLFLNMNQLREYQNKLEKFTAINQRRFRIGEFDQEFISVINDKTMIYVFIDLIINQIFSNTLNDNYIQEQQYIDFSSWAQYCLAHISLQPMIFNILSLFLSKDTFLTKIHSDILARPEANRMENLQMLLASYKLAFMCFNSNTKYFYGNLTCNGNLFENLSQYYLPGAEVEEFQLAQVYKEISDFLNLYNSYIHGAYVCSCGVWYEIEPCGSPWYLSKCPNCKLDIGGIQHALVKRDGHYRVYLDEKQKEDVFTRYMSYRDNENNYKLLAELKNEVEEMERTEKPGIKMVSFSHFSTVKKNVRGLTEISYRLLSFVLYSIAYYGHKVGAISDENFVTLLFDKKTCIEILECNWNFLKNSLESQGVKDIIIFINLLFPDLVVLFDEFPIISSNENRLDFESKVNVLVEKHLNDYAPAMGRYKEVNSEILGLDYMSMKSIIEEKEDAGRYDEKAYPYMKYLQSATYPSEDDMKTKLDSFPDRYKKYPVLTNFIEMYGNITKLENLQFINPMVNFMINRHSYRTSRDEAKKITIDSDLSAIKTESAENCWNNFQNSWKNISGDAVKFECKPEMTPLREIDRYHSIAYLLNDNGEWCYGMYLAAAYQNFILYQNSFIDNILANISQSGIARNYQVPLSSMVRIQDALPSEIVATKLEGDYESLSDYVKIYSLRNIFTCGTDRINYQNYRNITYDFQKLEELLSSLILPGKKRFAAEQKFVTYAYEAYRGEKSAILLKLTEKIRQEALNANERESVSRFCESKLTIDYFLNSLNLIIFYIHSSSLPAATSISAAIHKFPDYIRVQKDIASFFDTNPSFTLSKLLDVLEYVELVSYSKILDNVSDDYKKDINPATQQNITRYFERNTNCLISKRILATVIRRFVSRFLSGNLGVEEIKADENVIVMVCNKPDLWNKTIYENPKWDEEIDMMMKNEEEGINVKVNQSVKFYDILGGDQDISMIPKTAPSGKKEESAHGKQNPKKKGGRNYS